MAKDGGIFEENRRRLRNFVGKIINRGKIPSTGSRQSGYKISYDSQVKSVVNGSIIVGLDFLSIENIFVRRENIMPTAVRELHVLLTPLPSLFEFSCDSYSPGSCRHPPVYFFSHSVFKFLLWL